MIANPSERISDFKSCKFAAVASLRHQASALNRLDNPGLRGGMACSKLGNGNGECETREEKWEDVGVGHKSVRQLYFIEDEIEAVDVHNRLRSHLLIFSIGLVVA